jgi:hypothetical protein
MIRIKSVEDNQQDTADRQGMLALDNTMNSFGSWFGSQVGALVLSSLAFFLTSQKKHEQQFVSF